MRGRASREKPATREGDEDGEMRSLGTWGAGFFAAGLCLAGCAVAPDLSVDPTKRPRITSLQVPTTRVAPGGVVNLHVTAQSPDDSKLTYRWEATAGMLSDGSIPSPVWRAPESGFGQVGLVTITVRVTDDKGRQDSQQAQIAIDAR